MKILLASASPRRRELLSAAGVEFEVCPSSAKETTDAALGPQGIAVANAVAKARAVADEKEGTVIAADTVVAVDGATLGKPKDRRQAVSMLRLLSGRAHDVFTGFCVIYGVSHREVSGFSKTRVFFNALTDELIERYVDEAKPFDKAGSYGIQDGYGLVNRIEGSYTNVIGLPMEDILPLLKEAEDE